MINPVLRREAITTMRNWKTYGALAIFLIITALGANFFVYVSMFQNYNLSFDPQNMTVLYIVLASIQMGLVMLVAPAVAAGSISGERERQTLDLLLVTKMSPLSIVIGKLMASLMYILLLIVGSLPIFGIAFYFGSVSVLQILELFLFVLVNACMVGAISVFFSCVFKKTITSIVLMYLVIGVLCFGTLLLLGFIFISATMAENGEIPLLASVLVLIPNPGVAFFSMIDTQLGTDIVSSVMSSVPDASSMELWMASHMWLLHMVFDIVVAVVFVLLAAKMINPVKEQKRSRKK